MKILIGVILYINLVYANFSFKTFSANFEQIITNKQNQKIKYYGKIFIKNGKKSQIFWQYTKPIEKQIYISDTSVTIVEPDLEQAIISKIDKNLNLLDILNKSKKISKNKYQTILNNQLYTLHIYNNKLLSIVYNDELDNHISILFFNQQLNKKIDNQLFKANIPNFFDIISQ